MGLFAKVFPEFPRRHGVARNQDRGSLNLAGTMATARKDAEHILVPDGYVLGIFGTLLPGSLQSPAVARSSNIKTVQRSHGDHVGLFSEYGTVTLGLQVCNYSLLLGPREDK